MADILSFPGYTDHGWADDSIMKVVTFKTLFCHMVFRNFLTFNHSNGLMAVRVEFLSNGFDFTDTEFTERLLHALVDHLQSFDHVFQVGVLITGDENSDLENMIEGLQMVYKGMQEAFGKFGVSEIESIGKEFDPNCHQAVGMIESQEVPENHVAEECLKGYYLHDRIIRPTMVRVSGKG